MFALTLTLGLLKKKILNLENIDEKCTSETITVSAEKDQGSVKMVSIATRCYDEVCIQDAKILEDDIARATMSKYEKPAESVYTVDKPAGSTVPRAYCFDTLDLIAAVSEPTPVNPKTKEAFSDYSLELIQRRFHKEIAMYRRYKQIRID
jgi:hypothetical protein